MSLRPYPVGCGGTDELGVGLADADGLLDAPVKADAPVDPGDV
ncbi:MAG: hypothetical protein ACH36H_10900 [Candidatus Nanopelagicales bacterium]